MRHALTPTGAVRAASTAVVEGLEDRRLLSTFTALINFQPPNTSGYEAHVPDPRVQ